MFLGRILLHLKIRFKLLVAFGSILLLSVGLIITATNAIHKILQYKAINEEVDGLNVQILKLNIAETNFVDNGFKRVTFLQSGQSQDLDNFYEALEKIQLILDDLKNPAILSDNQAHNQIIAIQRNLKTYEQVFTDLVEVLKERGFKDYGVEGALRDAIHRVEDMEFDYNKATMLMLRRHEKDFFLRKDLRYLDKFNGTIDNFIQTIQNKQLPNNPKLKEAQLEILDNLDSYKSKFNYIVELEKKIGLSKEAGLKGEINKIRALIFPEITRLNTLIKSLIQKLINYRIILLFTLLFLQLSIGLFLVIFYSNLLTRAIKEIKRSMVSLAEGHFPEKMTIRTRDELGQTKIALNNLIERIRTATRFADALGNGKLNEKYDEKFNDDVLAKSIITLKDKLKEAEKEQGKINWTNEGIAHFNEILKHEQDDVDLLGQKIIRNLIEYLNANQGALFLLKAEGEQEQEFLERVATYAFNRKKFVRQRIYLGDNLLWQSVLERKSIFLKSVPQGYPQIVSGLGGATPESVLIVPLKVRDEVVGVLELASFEVWQDYQIAFVEKLSETFANVLYNKMINEQTHHLLNESQKKTEILTAQEEELRQNSEELRATQEELNRQKDSMQEEIERLREELEKRKNSSWEQV